MTTTQADPVSALTAGTHETDPLWLFIAAAAGAALSLLISGYSFGIGNNYFHLPILERLYDEPQFRDDAFMQSLRYFAAGPFLLLQGSARYISPELLFAVLSYLSRLICFIGLLLCARQLGITSRTERLVFVALASFTQILRGYSYAGLGGLFIEAFTHSEIANGILLISLYFATSGRLALAFSVNGLAFFTNAFMAVWNVVPLGFLILLLWRDGRITMPQIVRRGMLGLLGFAICAAPVLWNILSNPDFGHPIGIDYRAFLREYWPYHFIFGPNKLSEKLYLGVVLLSGVAAFTALGKPGKMLHAAFWGFVVVYGIGIVVPWITASPLVLNLHLLRSGAMLQLMTGLASACLATSWLLDQDRRRSMVAGPLLAFSLCTFRFLTIATPLIIAVASIDRVAGRIPAALQRRRTLTLSATAAILAVVWVYQISRTEKAHSATEATTQRWRAVGQWAHVSTDPAAMFMVPTGRADENGATPDKIGDGLEIFQFESHRRVWIDARSGAAAMWSPSYYAQWHDRVEQQAALPDLAAKLVFAGQNGIDYVIDHCGATLAAPAFAAADVCVYPSASATRATAGKG